MFTTAVVDREPVDAIESLGNDTEHVYFFAEIVDCTGRTVTHRWTYAGEVKGEVTFDVKGPRWRSYSKKRLLEAWTGTWLVEVVDDNGEVIYEARFVYESRMDSSSD